MQLRAAIAPLLILVACSPGLGCAGSQEQTTCGLDQAWKAYQRYREYSSSALAIDQPRVRDAVAVEVAAVACARRRNGTVLCWEAEESWQVPIIDDAQSIAVGTFGACAIRKAGDVICWLHDEIARHVRIERTMRDMEWFENETPPLVTVALPLAADRVCVSRPEITAGHLGGYRSGATWACTHGGRAASPLCWEIAAADRVEPETHVTSMHRHGASLPSLSPDERVSHCPPPWPTAEQPGAARALQAYDATVAAIERLKLEEALGSLKIAQREAEFLELWAVAGVVNRALGDPAYAHEIRVRYVACGGDPRRFDEWQPMVRRPRPTKPAPDLDWAEPEECAFREHQHTPCSAPLWTERPKTRFDDTALDGDAHACAIDESGQVWCWGDNDMGQLGDGTRHSRSQPVKARGVSDAVSIGVGLERTCAVRRSGRVSCWGLGAKPHSASASE